MSLLSATNITLQSWEHRPYPWKLIIFCWKITPRKFSFSKALS